MLPSASVLASRREERVQKAVAVVHHGPGDARLSGVLNALSGPECDYVQSIDKFVAVDAAVPDDLFKLMLYFLGIFIYMCRVPFSIVTNVHFVRFLWILRPNFAKKIVPRADGFALNNVPGRLTLTTRGSS